MRGPPSNPDYHAIGWAAALVLLVVVLTLSITARILSSRQQKRMA